MTGVIVVSRERKGVAFGGRLLSLRKMLAFLQMEYDSCSIFVFFFFFVAFREGQRRRTEVVFEYKKKAVFGVQKYCTPKR